MSCASGEFACSSGELLSFTVDPVPPLPCTEPPPAEAPPLPNVSELSLALRAFELEQRFFERRRLLKSLRKHYLAEVRRQVHKILLHTDVKSAAIRAGAAGVSKGAAGVSKGVSAARSKVGR